MIAIEIQTEDGRLCEEDPMSENMLDARRMTFGSMWPHEGKRGWACQTLKVGIAPYYHG